ncbi:hypothetical protein BJX68DRAFT_247927 [Aspergillus pseudodeflectus]|uniref:Uncharacterized protein n=1 Tax=Aspergillus pseudodeflectus TaxID=176178 RepID=A0ABR4JH19_9EURO
MSPLSHGLTPEYPRIRHCPLPSLFWELSRCWVRRQPGATSFCGPAFDRLRTRPLPGALNSLCFPSVIAFVWTS